MADIEWPWWLKPMAANVRLEGFTTAGGRALNGDEQVVQSDAGYVRATLIEVRCLTPERIRKWREIAARLGGRAGTVSLPIWDNANAFDLARVPHSDGTPFSDLSLYLSGSSSWTMSAVAAAGATQAAMVGGPYDLSPGMWFQHGAALYLISECWKIAGVWTVKFLPRLRAAAAIGDVVEFDRPRGTFRLAEPNGMGGLELIYGRWGTPSVEFIEA